MIFIDKVDISVRAGKGGDGKLSFRHEIYIAKGGPDGGDGGKGGNVIFKASRNQNTLNAFRYKKEIKADDGQPGDRRKMHGKTGKDLIVSVPIGTIVTDKETGKVLADLVSDDQEEVIAEGGNGGFGNAHFISSTRQAPNFAEKGLEGETADLSLELKMIADVGLVGLPNAGKSTFLSVVSNAHPEIADYPFTTLSPNLGVSEIDKDASILIADIPGLIEGAAAGKGLGHDFLRHIERTSVILHLIDSYNEDVAKTYQIIRNELEAYQPKLIKRPEIIALTKVEGLDQEIIADHVARLKTVAPKAEILAISSVAGLGVKPLLYQLYDLVQKEKIKKKPKSKKEAIPVIKLADDKTKYKVKKTKGRFIITGEQIESFGGKTDFNNTQAVQRLRDIMRKTGIMHELRRKKIKADDIIQVGNNEDNYFKY